MNLRVNTRHHITTIIFLTNGDELPKKYVTDFD